MRFVLVNLLVDMKMKFLVLLILSTATFSWASKGAQIIDEDQSLDVERVAEVVCDVTKGSGKQIGRAATIGKLADFFKNLSADHKLAKCRDQYGESVERLQQVLETGNGNVCGNDKLTVVEQFHRRYVSEAIKYKEKQETNGWIAPKLVKLAFMHYAYKISSMCEQSATIELAQIADKMTKEGDELNIDQLMSELIEVAGISDLSKGYDSVFSLWSLLDKLPLDKSDKFSRYLNGTSESRHKLTIAVQKAPKLRQIQEQCAQTMLPIYSRSLLGVLRLVDLGYYPEDGFLIKEMREMEASKRLFVMTQMCELLLPIKFVEDATLSAEQVVLLPSDEHVEDTNYWASLEQGVGYIEVLDNSLKNLETLELVNSDFAKSLAEGFEKAVRRRDGATKFIFKIMINCLKVKIKSKIKSLLMKVGGSNERVVEEDIATAVDENELATLVDGKSKQEANGLSRRKRGIGKLLGRFVVSLLYLINAAFMLVFALIYFGIYLTIVFGLSVLYKFFLKLTGIRILWIRNFQRAYHIPLIYAMEEYKNMIENDKD